MAADIFPERIETRRLLFERLGHETVDPFELYEFVTSDDWQSDALDHMPWFRFQRLDQVAGFIDHAEQEWEDRNSARYLLRTNDEDTDIVGTAAFDPEWESCRAGSDIVLAPRYWGREYGLERASVFVELTFDLYDLDAYFTTCAVDNEPSRRMIEKVVDAYGGQYEGRLRRFGAPRPSGEVTDQHRFSIVRSEYERATQNGDTLEFEMEW